MKQLIIASAVMLGAAAQAQTWDMPTPYGETTFHTENIRQFADEVETATDGDLSITVHPAGSLFPHAEIKNAVRSRQVPIGEFFLSTLSNENAVYGLDSQPFLATSYDQARTLWDKQKPVVTELLAEQDLMPLFSVAWPPQGLYTNGEIAAVEDLQGLRFRAYNAQLEQFASQAGASPVQVEAPDIAQAFSTGQIEAMITSPSTGANSAAWDFVSHYSPINAWVPKNLVVVNKRVFDALPEEQRQALQGAAARAEDRGWEMSRREAEAQTEVLRESGMTVYEPSEALVRGLREIGASMEESLRENASGEAITVIEGFNQATGS